MRIKPRLYVSPACCWVLTTLRLIPRLCIGSIKEKPYRAVRSSELYWPAVDLRSHYLYHLVTRWSHWQTERKASSHALSVWEQMDPWGGGFLTSWLWAGGRRGGGGSRADLTHTLNWPSNQATKLLPLCPTHSLWVLKWTLVGAHECVLAVTLVFWLWCVFKHALMSKRKSSRPIKGKSNCRRDARSGLICCPKKAYSERA